MRFHFVVFVLLCILQIQGQEQELVELVGKIRYDIPPLDDQEPEIFTVNKKPFSGRAYVKPGEYEIYIYHPFFFPMKETIIIKKGRKHYVYRKQLQARPRKFVLKVYDTNKKPLKPYSLCIDGKKQKIPTIIKPGLRKIEVRHKWYLPQIFQVVVHPDTQPFALNCQLQYRPRRVECKVFYGKKPITADIHIGRHTLKQRKYFMPGLHSLRAYSSCYESLRKNIIIPPGEGPYKVTLKMQGAPRYVTLEVLDKIFKQQLGDYTATLSGNPIRNRHVPGLHRLRIERDGYRVLDEQITIPLGEVTFILKKYLDPLPRVLNFRIRYDTSKIKGQPQFILAPKDKPNQKKRIKNGTKIIPGSYFLTITQPGYHNIYEGFIIWPSKYPLLIDKKLKSLFPKKAQTLNMPTKNSKQKCLLTVRTRCAFYKRQVATTKILGIKTIGQQTWLGSGSYTLLIKKAGYHSIRDTFTISANKIQKTLSYVLQPLPRIVRFVNQLKKHQPKDIRLNGEEVDQQTRFIPGKYELKVDSNTQKITIPPSPRPYVITYRGECSIREIECVIMSDFPSGERIDPEVFTLNGKDARDHVFAAGCYSLVIRNPGFKPIKETIFILPGNEPFLIERTMESLPRQIKFAVTHDVKPIAGTPPYQIEMAKLDSSNKLVYKKAKHGQKVLPKTYMIRIQQPGFKTDEFKRHVWPGAKPVIIDNQLLSKLVPIKFSSEIAKRKHVAIAKTGSNIYCTMTDGVKVKPGSYRLLVDSKLYTQAFSLYPQEGEYTLEIPNSPSQINTSSGKRSIYFQILDPKTQEIIFPLQTRIAGQKSILSGKYEFAIGKTIKFSLQFARHETVDCTVKMRKGKGPIILSIIPKKLKRYDMSLRRSYKIIDGVKYPFEFYADDQKIEKHLINKEKGKGRDYYTFWLSPKTRRIKVKAGYYYASRPLYRLRLGIGRTNNVDVNTYIKHLKKIAASSPQGKQTVLKIMRKNLMKYRMRRMLRQENSSEIEKLRNYLQKFHGGKSTESRTIDQTLASLSGGKKRTYHDSNVEEKKQATSLRMEKARKIHFGGNYKRPKMFAQVKGKQKSLALVSQDISVVIINQRVRVVRDMVFVNPHKNLLEGNLTVQLPAGASPCYLGMFQGKGQPVLPVLADALLHPKSPQVNVLLKKKIVLARSWLKQGRVINWGELRPAVIVKPETGRQVYEKITRRVVDPALGEWSRLDTFSTRIFPLPAKSYKRVIFAYDRPLTMVKNDIIYALPIAPGYHPHTRMTVHLLGKDFHKTSLFTEQHQLKSFPIHYGKIWRFSPGKNFSGKLIFQAQPKNPNLQVLIGHDAKLKDRLIHLRYRPPMETFVSRKTGRALFILDTSYSGKRGYAAKAGKILQHILRQDPTLTHFGIVGFDIRATWISKKFVANTEKQQNKVFQAISHIWLQGATDFSRLLQFLTKERICEKIDTIFFISDGEISWGTDDLATLRRDLGKYLQKRWICYRFGDFAYNKNIFMMLTKNKGQIIHIPSGQSLESSANAHRHNDRKIKGIFTEKNVELLISGNPKRLYPGQFLELAIRTKPGRKNLPLEIVVGEHKYRLKIPLNENVFTTNIAARAWAELYVNRLLASYQKKDKNLILALSQRFSLSNKLASFLILETDADYIHYKLEPKKLSYRNLLKRIVQPLSQPSALSIKGLSSSSQRFIAKLKQLPIQFINEKIKGEVQALYAPLQYKAQNKLKKRYHVATKLFNKKNMVDRLRALRILSTIVENTPKKHETLRMVGFVLLRWHLYHDAHKLFCKIRDLRPFEPQNYFFEAISAEYRGDIVRAALCYEIVLQRNFQRFGQQLKPLATISYSDLLKNIIQQNQGTTLATYARERLRRLKCLNVYHSRVLLFWNHADSDLDLSIVETKDISIPMSLSPTGGKILITNNLGLGPEMYVHPQNLPSSIVYKYKAHYDPKGEIPVMILCMVMHRQDHYHFYTQFIKRDEKISIPLKKVFNTVEKK